MITPQQAQAFSRDDEAEAAKCEAYIDARLQHYDTGPVTCIVNCSRRAATFLRDRYTQVGWLVEMSSSPDQRDPGWVLRFSIPSPPRSGPGR